MCCERMLPLEGPHTDWRVSGSAQWRLPTPKGRGTEPFGLRQAAAGALLEVSDRARAALPGMREVLLMCGDEDGKGCAPEGKGKLAELRQCRKCGQCWAWFGFWAAVAG